MVHRSHFMNIKTTLTVSVSLILYLNLFSQSTAGIEWQRAYGGKGYESPAMTARTSDGGYILLSTTDSSSVAVTGSHRNVDFWVVKINASGGIEWQKALGGSGSEFPYAIFVNNDGTYTLAGTTSSNDFDVSGHHGANGSDDVWIVKLSSTGTILWQRCYGGSTLEVPRSWIKNSTGNIVFAAYTLSSDGDVSGFHFDIAAGGGDIWVVEVSNSNGSIIAQKAYGGIYGDAPRSIIQQSDGKYVITGYTQSNDGDVSGNHNTPGSGGDIWILKLNTIISMDWQKCLGSPGAGGIETGYKVSESANRSLIILGEVFSNGGDVTGHHGGPDVWIAKLNENSNLVWQRSLGGSSAERAVSFFENSDASVVVLANTSSSDGDVSGYHSGTALAEDMWFVKLTSNGIFQWQKTYGGSESDGAFSGYMPSFFAGLTPSIFKQSDGGYVLMGFTNSPNGDVVGHHPPNGFPAVTAEDVWILKVSDANGAIQWQRCLGGSSSDRLTWAEQISPTEFFVSASTLSADGDVTGPRMSTQPDGDSWFVKLGSVNSIKGVVFVDNNNNGIKDIGEPLYSKVIVKSEKPGYMRIHTPVNGAFLNEVDTGSYITTLSLDYPYYTVLPAQRASVFANYFIIDSFGFALSPIPNKKDLMIGIIPQNGIKPGATARYKVLYENLGTVVMTGTVKLVKDNRTSFVSSVPPPASIVADTITYNFSNFNPLAVSSIIIDFTVGAPPTVNINDTLRNIAMIFPQAGDETVFNNNDTILQRVTGSFDPNDKTESHGAFITTAEINNGEQLSYLVRFQNTGTDTAYNIIIRDTLDTKLQWDKIQTVSSSHPCTLQVIDGRYLSWHFNSIKLADSTHNEPASHGYIYFRVKPQTNLTVGDTIKNNASIYFDFNLPVKTNTVNVVVKSPPIVTGLNNPVPQNDWDVVVYPNPTNGIVNIAVRGRIYGEADLQISDQLGRKIAQHNLGMKNIPVLQSQINLATLQAGIYYLTIQCHKESKTLTIKIR